jgi:hypothetical protein
MNVLLETVKRMSEDPRVGPPHISVFVAVLCLAAEQGVDDGVAVRARTLMPLAKIGGRGLFFRTIRELDAYGYCKYVPSCDKRVASRVWWGDAAPGRKL